MKLLEIICIFFATLCIFSCGKVSLENIYPPDVIEDGKLLTDELIRKYKYPAETHFVITSDKYILRMHRIPKPGGRPILLQHGLLDSSATYILMGPNLALGYYLYDLGYDVWMGNARGNRYSRNHTTLNPDIDKAFWNFSWHEIAVFDIPAMIDYILYQTNSLKLIYVGHSQGTTVLFVMCSMRPEYNEKIILAHALAPVAFMKHIRTPLLPLGQQGIEIPVIKSMLEFLPNANLFKGICMSGQNAEEVCLNVYYMLVGKDVKQFNRTRFIMVLGHLPAGIAMKQVTHYLQLIKSDKFRQYDYVEENKKIYCQNEPPDYDLKKVTVPIAMHYSLNDYLSEPVDVVRLKELLPNVIDFHKMEIPQWNHMDFLYAFDARKLLYTRIHELNKRFFIEK
ncbi:lipase 1-like [Episyrphus balteatus]|uniref:lipase 1-like n=1 Tax=Episyrphus balteatus TaxID=286459 RepID=UPI00248572C9|nr:lipase 1-like [Episyrphus balteatus]